jgi:RNA 2',3'-cyclic 3'-phosphodiesterase
MNPLPETLRAFVAIRLPESLIAELLAVQSQLKERLENVSWTRPEAMHLTLHFFGSIQSADLPEILDSLEEVTRKHAPFELTARGVGSFGSRVLWAGLEGECAELNKVAQAVRSAVVRFGEHEEDRKFNGHITLGRFRAPARGLGAKLHPCASHLFGTWQVDHVELIRSELSPNGSRYTTLGIGHLKP